MSYMTYFYIKKRKKKEKEKLDWFFFIKNLYVLGYSNRISIDAGISSYALLLSPFLVMLWPISIKMHFKLTGCSVSACATVCRYHSCNWYR